MSAAGPSTLHAHELHDVVGWLDAQVRDLGGRRLGRVRAIFADAAGTPWWIVVRHRGRDVVAPVGAVYDTRHHELLLDRELRALVACPAEIDAAAHDALVERFRLAPEAPPAGRRGACSGRLTRIRRVLSRRG